MSVEIEVEPGFKPAVTEGEWAGWSAWAGNEPFEDYAGPYYAKRDADGRMISGCRVDAKNLNGTGSIHGGALLTFADYALFQIAYDALKGQTAVTVTLSGEFLAAAPLGSRLIARGDVVKAGRSLLFVRGLIDADGELVLNFSGVLKVLRPRS